MPSDVSLREIRKLLEQHGWQLVRIKGSHHIFKGEGRRLRSVPVHKGKVKHRYLQDILEEIAELQASEEACEEAGEQGSD